MDTTRPTEAREELSMGERSYRAFLRDLRALLQDKTKEGLWVAYHGDRQVGFARDPVDLYERCRDEKVPREDFIVCPVEPAPPDEVDSPYPLD